MTPKEALVIVGQVCQAYVNSLSGLPEFMRADSVARINAALTALQPVELPELIDDLGEHMDETYKAPDDE